MPSPDYIPPQQPLPDWLKEILAPAPVKPQPFRIPEPEKKEKVPA